MKRPFDFSFFSNTIQKKELEKEIKDIGEDINKNYVYVLLQNDFSIEDIDFNKFDFEDLITLCDELDSVLTNENDDGDIFVDPDHPYTRIWSLQLIHVKMESLPKKRVKSPFLFL